jgi:hypothetical protein
MKSTDTPPRMPLPFGQHGPWNAIPEASQISVTKGAASLNDGFPPLTMTSPLEVSIGDTRAHGSGLAYWRSPRSSACTD